MTYEPYFQAHIWACLTCAFTYVGGQPKMECPVCAAAKANFVNFPQHLEAEVRDAFPDVPPNHMDARAKRLELINDHDIRGRARCHGRVTPSVSGENVNDTFNDQLR